MKKLCSIVLGTMFGDEAKGLTVDHLCGKASDPIVVRFSGGQQAGHTVIYNGIKHTHSSFGAGTLRGVPTYFTEDTTVYLNTMINELEVLKVKGINPKVYCHPLAMLTTPYDVAFNQAIEVGNKHGSCGLGVGATMKRSLNTGFKLFTIDLLNKSMLWEKLNNIGEYYFNLATERDILKYYDTKVLEESLSTFESNLNNIPFEIKNYNYLEDFDNIIFEGSQGILLDMDHGVFPNVTYASTTSKNALKIIDKLGGKKQIHIYYVTRCYQNRHGNGWMSNNVPIDLINNGEEINTENQWQGKFRTGEMDYELLNHAFNIDQIYSYKIPITTNKHLVVSCLDQRPEFKLRFDLLPEFNTIIGSYSPDSSSFTRLNDAYEKAIIMSDTDEDIDYYVIPEIALEYKEFIYGLHGKSSENRIIAFTKYNQAIMGMSCCNEKYKLTEGEKNWFIVKNYFKNVD